MSTKATQDRYIVMETYVTIMKGNTKSLEQLQNKLIEVLSIVFFLLYIYRDQNIHLHY